MSNTTSFLVGFCCAALISAALALVIYIRALRRVRSIKAAIQHYQQAQSVVGDAISRSYPKS